MNRRLLAGGIAALLIGTVAGGFVWLRGGATSVPLEDTVRRYRSADPVTASAPTKRGTTDGAGRRATRPTIRTTPQPAKRASALVQTRTTRGSRPLPPHGVYSYATTGYDEVDALGGSRHTYPRETTITVRHEGCGLIERWDALEERWDERESCRTSKGDRLARVTSYHQFFRQGDQRTLRCDGYTYPVGARPGDSWTMRCESGTTRASLTLRAVGYEDVAVAGTPVRALHVRVDTKVSGEQTGEGHRDVWGAQDSGLVLRERSSLRSESVQPAIGRVTYRESYELRLKSLTPRR